MDVPSLVRELIVRLLHESHLMAQLADVVAMPPDHYTLHIGLADEPAKSLIISRQIVEGALTKPAALRSLRLLLRSAVLRTRSHRAADQGRIAAALAPLASDTRMVAQSCEGCREPIMLSEPVVVRRARLFHRRCAPPPRT